MASEEKKVTINRLKSMYPLRAHVDESYRKGIEAMKEGAVDFMEKPAELPTLLEKIDAAASQRLTLVEKRSIEQIHDLLHRKGW